MKILKSNILKLSTKIATKSIETLSIQKMNPRKTTSLSGVIPISILKYESIIGVTNQYLDFIIRNLFFVKIKNKFKTNKLIY